MRTHLRRVLEVAVAVTAAAWAYAIPSPVVAGFLERHPQDAAYVSLAAGVVVAAYKAARDALRAQQAPAPPSDGSSMGAR